MSVVVDPAMLTLVRDQLVAAGGPPSVEAIGAIVRGSGRMLDRLQLDQLTRLLHDELTGLGPLAPLLADPAVTDVLVNAPDEVWVDRGQGLEHTSVRLRDESAVRALAVRLAMHAHRRLDDAAPCVDGRLPAGQRLHAVLAPVSTRGTVISIRVPGRRRFALADLVAAGTLDDEGAAWLGRVIAARAAFLVCGGTGCGKTTVLGALLAEVPADERIVIVEDTAELRPDHPHVVTLEARPPNVEGSGEISLRTLVRQALRMRPDRLVVGEVRGAEVVDLLAGLNTGHEGGCGTIHANAAAAVPARIEALALAAGMPLAGVRAQLRAGVEVVVHLARTPSGARVVAGVGVLRPGDAGEVDVLAALVHRQGRLVPGPGLPALAERVGHP